MESLVGKTGVSDNFNIFGSVNFTFGMIFRKKKTEISGSLNYLAWQRFKRNKLSMTEFDFYLIARH
ncbi:MAG: hypothetical protein MZV63_26220 [Marinilabiliales bacterium]|nr:hypothetical protein [Marinilabiliales bacterium]